MYQLVFLDNLFFQFVVSSGASTSEKSERSGGDFDVIFTPKGMSSKFYAIFLWQSLLTFGILGDKFP